jgi:hypothetical protein
MGKGEIAAEKPESADWARAGEEKATLSKMGRTYKIGDKNFLPII